MWWLPVLLLLATGAQAFNGTVLCAPGPLAADNVPALRAACAASPACAALFQLTAAVPDSAFWTAAQTLAPPTDLNAPAQALCVLSNVDAAASVYVAALVNLGETWSSQCPVYQYYDPHLQRCVKRVNANDTTSDERTILTVLLLLTAAMTAAFLLWKALRHWGHRLLGRKVA